VGIKAGKLSKRGGIFEDDDILPIALLDASFADKEQEEPESLPLEKTGLYEVLYVDKQAQTELESHLSEIAECLKKIFYNMIQDSDSGDSNEETLIPLLSDLLTPISYMVKDKDWKHEEEYRLFYMGTAGEKCVKSDCENGMYIDTAPFLFKSDDDEVYLGPKVDDIAFLKCTHSFKRDGLKAHIQKSQSQLR